MTKGKASHKGAYDSGMRGGEKPQHQEPDADQLRGGSDHDADNKPSVAHASGLRGKEKPPVKSVEQSLATGDAQAAAQQVAQGLQPGTGTEALAQGEEPAVIDAGDHYQIPKASLIDGGDHYKLMKKAAGHQTQT